MPNLPKVANEPQDTGAVKEDKKTPSAGERPVKPPADSPPPAEKVQTKAEATPVISSPEDRRAEYTEVNSNIRHYSSLRFAILTVFFGATGGLASVAFNVFNLRNLDPYVVSLTARIAGFCVTLLFFKYELLVQSVLKHNRQVGANLEKAMGLIQIQKRPNTLIDISRWAARLLYIVFLAFWLWTIWETVRTVQPTCDDCV
jgi:hypothetical protein